MNKQPEALRLAEDLEKYLGGNTARQAAAELRRLYALNAELLEVLKKAVLLMESDSVEIALITADYIGLEELEANNALPDEIYEARAAIAKVEGRE